MRIYLSADIEGTCGIADWAETERAAMDDYRPFAAQMTAEVAAACEGAVAAGAEEIVVKDAHDSARNLDGGKLPRQARLFRGWTGDPLSMMAGLDGGQFGAVLFTGYHAWAACGGNPLSHTMTTQCDQVTLNQMPASEFLINAYTAGYCGVPVPFLSGDAALCNFARNLIPSIVTVAVNEGRGGGVLAMHPQAAVEAIRAGAQEAVARADACRVPMPAYFATTVRYREHKDAYRRSFYPGAALEDDKTIFFGTDNWYEMLRFYHFVL